MMFLSPVVLTFTLSIIIRWILAETRFTHWLSLRNEISSPLTSWKRTVEGIALHDAGFSPYDGDIYHEAPLMLFLMKMIVKCFKSQVYLVFLICDLLIASLLDKCVIMLLKDKKNDKGVSMAYSTRIYVVLAYLLNPYTIVTCLSKSTVVFNNLAIVAAFYFILKGRRYYSCFFIVIATYLSLYPIVLIVPACIYLHKVFQYERYDNKLLLEIAKTLILSLLMLGLLMYVSHIVNGSLNFVYSCYGFILNVPDLSPNLGLFWYFFTEMFGHFRFFFICVFQINAFIYLIPLTIRFKKEPIFLMFVLIALCAIFKSYPTYGDSVIYLSLIPLWRHTYGFMRNTFVVTCMFIICSILAPILWYLWIYTGSANANFYFANSLAYSSAQIFLVSDIIYAFLRHEYSLTEKGANPVMKDGSLGTIKLE